MKNKNRKNNIKCYHKSIKDFKEDDYCTCGPGAIPTDFSFKLTNGKPDEYFYTIS